MTADLERSAPDLGRLGNSQVPHTNNAAIVIVQLFQLLKPCTTSHNNPNSPFQLFKLLPLISGSHNDAPTPNFERECVAERDTPVGLLCMCGRQALGISCNVFHPCKGGAAE